MPEEQTDSGTLTADPGAKWSDPQVPVEDRIGDFIETHQAATMPWEDVRAHFKERFPTEHPDTYKKLYESGKNLIEAKDAFSTAELSPMETLKNAVPFRSLFGNYRRDESLLVDAHKRADAGAATYEDAMRIAAHERGNEIASNRSTGENIVQGISRIPAIALEAAGPGKLLGLAGKAGIIGSAGGKALAEAPFLSKLGAARTLGTTALMPSMYMEDAQRRAEESRTSITDLKNMAPALALGTLNVAVLGSLSKWAEGVGGPSLADALKRGALRTGAGLVEQQAVDTLARTVGLHTEYGAFEDLLDGKMGEGLKKLAVQAVTFASFAAMHAPGEQVQKRAEKAKAEYTPPGGGAAAALLGGKPGPSLGDVAKREFSQAENDAADRVFAESVKQFNVLKDQGYTPETVGKAAPDMLKKMAEAAGVPKHQEAPPDQSRPQTFQEAQEQRRRTSPAAPPPPPEDPAAVLRRLAGEEGQPVAPPSPPAAPPAASPSEPAKSPVEPPVVAPAGKPEPAAPADPIVALKGQWDEARAAVRKHKLGTVERTNAQRAADKLKADYNAARQQAEWERSQDPVFQLAEQLPEKEIGTHGTIPEIAERIKNSKYAGLLDALQNPPETVLPPPAPKPPEKLGSAPKVETKPANGETAKLSEGEQERLQREALGEGTSFPLEREQQAIAAKITPDELQFVRNAWDTSVREAGRRAGMEDDASLGGKAKYKLDKILNKIDPAIKSLEDWKAEHAKSSGITQGVEGSSNEEQEMQLKKKAKQRKAAEDKAVILKNMMDRHGVQGNPGATIPVLRKQLVALDIASAPKEVADVRGEVRREGLADAEAERRIAEAHAQAEDEALRAARQTVESGEVPDWAKPGEFAGTRKLGSNPRWAAESRVKPKADQPSERTLTQILGGRDATPEQKRVLLQHVDDMVREGNVKDRAEAIDWMRDIIKGQGVEDYLREYGSPADAKASERTLTPDEALAEIVKAVPDKKQHAEMLRRWGSGPDANLGDVGGGKIEDVLAKLNAEKAKRDVMEGGSGAGGGNRAKPGEPEGPAHEFGDLSIEEADNLINLSDAMDQLGRLPREPEEGSGGGGGPSNTQPSAEQRTLGDPERVTSTQKKITEAERKTRDQNPIAQEAAREWGDVWNNVLEEVDANPEAGARLVNDLAGSPRALDDFHNALLLHRKIEVHLGYEAAKDRLKEAKEGGDAATIAQAEHREAAWLSQVDLVDRIDTEVGRATGRGLNARKMMAKFDFSLDRMLSRARQAKGGELNDVERKEIAALHEKIAELQKKVDAAGGDKGPAQAGTPKGDLLFDLWKEKGGFRKKLDTFKLENRTTIQKALGSVTEAMEFFRSLMTSIDLPNLRQGAFFGLSHPVEWAKIVPESILATFSDKAAFHLDRDIKQNENYTNGNYDRLGLDFTKQGGGIQHGEEGFVSRWAKKVPIIKQVVEGSERGYVTALNMIRSKWADILIGTMTAKPGIMSDAEAKVIGNMVNAGTGRGDLMQFKNAAKELSMVAFAPKWVFSRFQIVTGQPIWTTGIQGGGRARALVAGEYAKMLVGLGTVYAMAKLAFPDDVTIEKDPRGTDFGKLKIGNTRLDITGNMASTFTFLNRVVSGETLNQKGEVKALRPGDENEKMKFGQRGVSNVIGDFARGKLAPLPGTIWDLAAKEDVVHKPVTPASAATKLVVPLYARDVHDALMDLGVPKVIAVSLVGVLGAGMTTYDQKKPTPKLGSNSKPPVTPDQKRRALMGLK